MDQFRTKKSRRLRAQKHDETMRVAVAIDFYSSFCRVAQRDRDIISNQLGVEFPI